MNDQTSSAVMGNASEISSKPRRATSAISEANARLITAAPGAAGFAEKGSMSRTCKCAETLIERPDGRIERIQSPAGHDCGYVRKRNALIPAAEERAIELAGEREGFAFTQAFSREMDRLARGL